MLLGVFSLLRRIFAPWGSKRAKEINRPEPPSTPVVGTTPEPGDTPWGGESGFGLEGSPFVTGQAPLFVSSSWLDYARYHPEAQELEIGYRGGWVAFYGPLSPEVAESFERAGSKGGWVHKNLKAGYQADGKHWIHATGYRPG